MTTTNGYWDASAPVDEITARTFASFGYEWTTFDAIRPEDERFWQGYFADVPVEALRGAVALDAGCGKGRFARFTAPHVRALVALDGSAAVEAAARNLKGVENTVVVRADLMSAPLAAEAFDFIYCLGVLHHLADPEGAFDLLVRWLKPGGRLLVYVYSRPEGGGVRAAALRAAAMLRRVSLRLPHPILRTLTAPLSALLYLSFVLPGRIGTLLRVGFLERLPLQTYRGRPLRSLWLDTFDRLSAPIERRYTWPELMPWYERHGLEVLSVREDAGLFVLARKP